MEPRILQIALDTPLDMLFDYRWRNEPGAALPMVGQIVLVPFGRRTVAGVIVAIQAQSDLPDDKLKDVIAIRQQVPPLGAEWLDLCRFAADYYQRPLGEVALPSLPKNLRALTSVALNSALKKQAKIAPLHDPVPVAMPLLNSEQQIAVDTIAGASGFAPILLHGVTGSGKTEVYLQTAAHILARDDGAAAQVLILIPEINLTPQLEASVRQRFPGVAVVSLHSGLAEGERMRNWLAAHTGQARIVLGTRLAVLSSLPHLKMIVIDEEHDPSYKQQEGLRYSARDLAVWRAHQLGIPVVLGSATPSLETWQHAQSGRYRKLVLRQRAVADAVLPKVGLIDMERDKGGGGLTSTLAAALRLRLERGEQSLLFLNRRGYAPVLSCDACGWISNCTRCTAMMVLHKPEHRLRCHHCSLELRIPRSCPTCGNVDLQPLGRGTQRIEEHVQAQFPEARILRIDADSTRRKGSAQAAFDSVHGGDVDILIGTQMVSKGHDFKNLTLVGILNPDTALFSHDYRASERLFAQLMQVAGRAGRAAQKTDGNPGQVLIQTRYPQHPLFAALGAYDYDGFANALLEERQQAAMPPFIYQALLRAEAKELETALQFLQQAAECLNAPDITIHDPIPMTMVRVANQERAQLLIECVSRPALQAFLKQWLPALRQMKSRVKWSVEVDPVDI
ncbi:primosomal protein N' [Herbaspirillum sp. RTI4]|uniref:primosomal protein N' n=1 Tax=Herbaspirillum sp. RTI4 TaxID=3048640 RepID=UPI002AB5732D|nr:primosomal protein N' [Herbaspirillum sp. RTI4]MDY7576977.1 primosomal protein N' [Herbaspirillum sp. RTI4]MEA9982121.1 primosomal protein N' [Herbaspirillum sp. RTI4]